jgi:chromosomal replication initiation ATPase DnaA
MTPPAPRQLALDLPHETSFAREDFLRGASNAAALALVESWPDWPSRIVALTGPEGSGKSHLAAIWANLAGARFLAARALGETHLPTALATSALVVEDLSAERLDERALFHLLNLAREYEAYVLITARTAPGECKVGLADLASRLRAMPVVRLAPLDDALMRAVLVKLFADRQLNVDESLVSWLVTHLERSFAAARAAVATLDGEALRRKRRLTRKLAAEVLR